MNSIDLVLILILGWAAWKGFSRGLVIELASLLALILGTYVAVRFSWVAANLIHQYVDLEGHTLQVISFSITFIAIVLLVMLVGKLLEKIVNLVMLGMINRIGGVVFSVGKIAVILSILMMLLHIVDTQGKVISEEKKEGSSLYSPIEAMAPFLLKTLHLNGLILTPRQDDALNSTEEEQPKDIRI